MLNAISRNPLAALLASTGTLAAVSAMAVTGLVLVGLPSVNGESQEKTAGASAPAQADWHESPATAVLTAALSAPPPGWAADGDIQQSVTAPLPYSCPLPGAAASTALARSFNVGGHRIRVTTLAYTAGLGAEALQQQLANTNVCASDASVRSSTLSGPARDARLTTTSRGGISTATVLNRRGDVITYVTGSPGAPLHDLARALDPVLAGVLNGVCLNQDSAAGDSSRSPFAPAGYQPFAEEVKVSIPKPAVPTESPSVKAVAVPAPVLVPAVATPMREPGYPVYPPMPEPVALPAAPEAPADAVTETTVSVPAEDKAGPGCGWAFTGMTAPLFDVEKARTARAALASEANTKLIAGVRAWQEKTTTYWAEYAAYEKAAAAYNAYRTTVNEVNSAWSSIARSWDDFRKKDAAYQAAVTTRDDFSARKVAAETDFAAATELCSTPVPVPAPKPSATPAPAPTSTASPTSPAELEADKPADPPPSASATPSPSPTQRQGCPAVRPKILDQAAPPVPDQPVPPADPRPKQ